MKRVAPLLVLLLSAAASAAPLGSLAPLLPTMYYTRWSVPMNDQQAGWLQIPVPLGFEDEPLMGDWKLKGRNGAFITFHAALPRMMNEWDRDVRAGILADGVAHLKLNVGESCEDREIRRLAFGDGWDASYVEVNCKGKRTESRSIALVVSAPRFTFDMYASKVSLEQVKEIISHLTLSTQVRGRIQGATLGLPDPE